MTGRPNTAQETLARLLRPVVEGAGADLEAVSITPAGKRRVVRVVVDADGGVDLDRVADVSRDVSQLLDTEPEADRALGGAPYVLEVTSPGTDRPLTEPRHWRRALGRLVAVRLVDGVELTGRVVAAEESAATLDTATGARAVTYAEVARAVVQVEFDRKDAGDEDESHGGAVGQTEDGDPVGDDAHPGDEE